MKPKRTRGFVMTGGGAKGSYEAGVIHAFHITGMEFDVITGSSIGAMNSVVYAEYLYRKKTELTAAEQADPFAAVECMDPYIKAFHHVWLKLPDLMIVDDSETGPIGKLKDDLVRFNVSLPQVVRLAWWYRDPDRGAVPGPELWRDVLGLLRQLGGRLTFPELLRLLKDHPHGLVKSALRAYLKPKGLELALVPPSQDMRLANAFSDEITPLHAAHLDGNVSAEYDPRAPHFRIVDPNRTFRDYSEQKIDLRLTRTNYRTGRFEMSSYVKPENFVRYMEKQAWRLEAQDPASIPLGSFRVQMPGNPKVINAGLASGRYPGVFAPYSLRDIYPEDDAGGNGLFYRLVDRWLDDPETVAELKKGYDTAQAAHAKLDDWDGVLAKWQASKGMQGIFPRRTDAYVDGGAIDNTPSNPAVDAIRELADREGWSHRETELELWVVYLNEEPRAEHDETPDVALLDVVQRTLKIVDVAKKSADANTVDTINTFGERGEKLGRALQAVLVRYEAALQKLLPEERSDAEEELLKDLHGAGLRLPRIRAGEPGAGTGPDGDGPVYARLGRWAGDVIDRGLPVPVKKVIIYPDRMPLGTLNFTPRMGYDKMAAIDMLTSGCYNTLFALRNRLERDEDDLDDADKRSLVLAKHWMAADREWPHDEQEQLKMEKAWHCTRTACSLHAKYCPKGAKAPIV